MNKMFTSSRHTRRNLMILFSLSLTAATNRVDRYGGFDRSQLENERKRILNDTFQNSHVKQTELEEIEKAIAELGPLDDEDQGTGGAFNPPLSPEVHVVENNIQSHILPKREKTIEMQIQDAFIRIRRNLKQMSEKRKKFLLSRGSKSRSKFLRNLRKDKLFKSQTDGFIQELAQKATAWAVLLNDEIPSLSCKLFGPDRSYEETSRLKGWTKIKNSLIQGLKEEFDTNIVQIEGKNEPIKTITVALKKRFMTIHGRINPEREITGSTVSEGGYCGRAHSGAASILDDANIIVLDAAEITSAKDASGSTFATYASCGVSVSKAPIPGRWQSGFSEAIAEADNEQDPQDEMSEASDTDDIEKVEISAESVYKSDENKPDNHGEGCCIAM